MHIPRVGLVAFCDTGSDRGSNQRHFRLRVGVQVRLMSFLNLNSIILAFSGAGFLVFARRLSNLLLKHSPKNWMTRGLGKELLFVWPIRGMGVMCIVFSFLLAPGGPVSIALAKDENRIALLEDGKITTGEVKKVRYERLAPKGWSLYYEFAARGSRSGEERIYKGGAQGPKKYYGVLTAGDPVDVLYHPNDPENNGEIRYVLNNPKFRSTLREAGKLGLLDRFRDDYDVRDYSYAEWYGQQHEK